MIQQLLQTKVDAMQANGDSFSFLHAEPNWQNLLADEEVWPGVYVDMPIKYKPVILAGGAFYRTYIGVAMFLYKSELDDNPDQKYTAYEKAEAAQREFQLLLEKDKDEVKDYSIGECYQVINLFDCNLDGVVMPFQITPRNFLPVCLPDPIP